MPKGLTPREELLLLQKRIFRENDRLIRSQAIVQEPSFSAYENRYKKHVRNYESISSIEELTQQIALADIIYLGDYHTNKQSQRMLLRLLRLLVERKIPLAVGIEWIQHRHQPVLETYQQEKISTETFLKKIQFEKHWYFDLWENFRPIFDFTRHHKIPLFGIEKSLSGNPTLSERDRENAEIIAGIVRTIPDRKLILFVGDLHVAPPHLPAQVQRQMETACGSDLILYQNSEAIYWKLAEQELEDRVEIVRIDERSFCLINTPPIIWQQSYLNWLEHEEGSIDYVDAKYSFLGLLRSVAEFLEISLDPSRLEDVEVFTCGDLSFLKKLEEDGSFTRPELRRIKKQILASESYSIPSKNYVYLANLSINHAAEEAAHFLKFLCAGPEEPRYLVDAFYANTLHEAFGFFGSKIINHKRKCFHEKEYEGLVNYLRSPGAPKSRRLQMEMALLILDHKEKEKRGDPLRHKRFFKMDPDLFFGVTHGLGYILGDKLYYALLQGKITKEELRELFCDPIQEEGRPFEVYRELVRRLRSVKIPKRV